MPNYHYEDLQNLLEHYGEANASQKNMLAHPAVLIDANHSNSGKQYLEQIRICKDVMLSCKVSPDVRNLVKVSEHCYGKSITDPCLGWDKSEKLIYELAELW